MTYEAQVTMRAGAKQPVFGQAAAASGTLTIAPGASVSLYQSDGTAVFSGTAVSGCDTGAVANPRVWYVLDTAALAAGTYNLVFAFTATGSADSIARNLRSDVQINVLPNVEIAAATYDPSTLIGQTRFHAADTDIPNVLFSDPELNYCLTLTHNIPELAAAKALRSAAADNAKIAIATKLANFGTDSTEVYKALMAMAIALENAAPVIMAVASPDVIFTQLSDDGNTPGTLDIW